MNILFVTRNYLPRYGGIELLVYNLCFYLQKKRQVPIVWNFSRAEPIQSEWDVIFSDRKHQKWKTLLQLLQVLKKRPQRIVMVEPQRTELGYVFLMSLLTWQRPYLLLVGTKTEIQHPFIRLLCALLSKKILALSKYCKTAFRFAPRKVEIVYAGFTPQSVKVEKKKNVLSVCRIDRRKNIEALFEVEKILRERDFVLEFVIVGEIQDPDYFNSLKRKYTLADKSNIRFVGRTDPTTLWKYYSSSYLFFLPSLHEMFGIVLAEAMYAGLPCVTSRVSAIPEVVPPTCGFLTRPDDYQGMADYIQKLYNTPQLYQKTAQHCRQHAQQFVWDRIITRYLKNLELE